MSEIKPALTPEEWTVWQATGSLMDLPGNTWMVIYESMGSYTVDHHCDADQRKKVAATALYGQPFGFTQDDVALLRKVVELNGIAFASERMLHEDECNGLDHLADRIAALLPPEPQS